MQVLLSRGGLLIWSNRAGAMYFSWVFAVPCFRYSYLHFQFYLNQGLGTEKNMTAVEGERTTREHSFQPSSEVDGTVIRYLPYHPDPVSALRSGLYLCLWGQSLEACSFSQGCVLRRGSARSSWEEALLQRDRVNLDEVLRALSKTEG